MPGEDREILRRVDVAERVQGRIDRDECLLADEPVSNLNPELAREVLGLMREECAASGCTVICALHDAAFTEEFSDARLRLDGSGSWEYTANSRAAQPA